MQHPIISRVSTDSMTCDTCTLETFCESKFAQASYHAEMIHISIIKKAWNGPLRLCIPVSAKQFLQCSRPEIFVHNNRQRKPPTISRRGRFGGSKLQITSCKLRVMVCPLPRYSPFGLGSRIETRMTRKTLLSRKSKSWFRRVA